MNVLKKITGVALIFFTVILSLAILVTIKNALIDATKVIEEEGKTSGIFYSLGSLFGIIFFIFLTIYIFKLGCKMLKNTKTKEDSIDDIGL